MFSYGNKCLPKIFSRASAPAEELNELGQNPMSITLSSASATLRFHESVSQHNIDQLYYLVHQFLKSTIEYVGLLYPETPNFILQKTKETY